MWYICTMDYHSMIQKEWNPNICNKMHKITDHHTKWNKPDTGKIPNDVLTNRLHQTSPHRRLRLRCLQKSIPPATACSFFLLPGGTLACLKPSDLVCGFLDIPSDQFSCQTCRHRFLLHLLMWQTAGAKSNGAVWNFTCIDLSIFV